MTGCYDCKRPYGAEHGFPDLIIPNWAWRQISPTGDNGGLLCPSCILARLEKAGLACEGAFMSGPFDSVDRVTMYNLRWIESEAISLHAMLAQGEGMDATRNSFRRIQSLRRETESLAQRAQATAFTQPALDKAKAALTELSAYYPAEDSQN